MAEAALAGDEATALRINGDGPRALARACAAQGAARLIHVSTDYVFDGRATTPYPEDHPTAPRTAYGRTKLAGERAVLAEHPGGAVVLRTAWLYGAHGRNFVRTMLELEARRDTLELNLEASIGSSGFRRTRQGPASELVPAWVDEVLAGG